MDASGVLQIIATIGSIAAMGIGLWVRMQTVVKRESERVERRLEKLSDKLQQTRDELSEYKLRATEIFAHQSRLADVEQRFLALIKEVRDGQAAIQKELARLTSIITALEERMTHMERKNGE